MVSTKSLFEYTPSQVIVTDACISRSFLNRTKQISFDIVGFQERPRTVSIYQFTIRFFFSDKMIKREYPNASINGAVWCLVGMAQRPHAWSFMNGSWLLLLLRRLQVSAREPHINIHIYLWPEQRPRASFNVVICCLRSIEPGQPPRPRPRPPRVCRTPVTTRALMWDNVGADVVRTSRWHSDKLLGVFGMGIVNERTSLGCLSLCDTFMPVILRLCNADKTSANKSNTSTGCALVTQRTVLTEACSRRVLWIIRQNKVERARR